MGHGLTREGILSQLGTRIIGRTLEVHDVIDSTNTRATALARAGTLDGTLVLADEQTGGRGRLGRRWHAPASTSLLMSLVLRPPLTPMQAQRATMICSLAAVDAISGMAGVEAMIKWPNDLLIDAKKVGGVLTELGLKGKKLEYVIVGMGINVNLDTETLPDLMAPATSLSTARGRAVSRLDLLISLLQHLDVYYARMCSGWSPHTAWRRVLATLGQSVRVGTQGAVIEGIAEDVNADGALLVRRTDGTIETILVGDVTLRGHALA